MVAIHEEWGDRNRAQRRAQERPETTRNDQRLPPQNLDAERGVLGSVILDNDALHEVVPILRSGHFYRDEHQILFDAIRTMYLDTRPVDTVTLDAELTKLGVAEKVGGLDYLLSLQSSVPHAVNAKYYAQIVVQHAVKRELIQAANEILAAGYDPEATAEDLLEDVQRRVFAISEEQAGGDTFTLSEVLKDALARINARIEGQTGPEGTPTGFADVDAMIGGMSGGQLIVLAARPSMGKTAKALNICDHVAVVSQKPALFVSLEMGKIELAERLVSIRSGVDGNKIRTGKGITKDDMTRISRVFGEYETAKPIMIDDTAARTVSQITANARRLKMRHDIGLVVVDYIQLITPEDGRDSRQEQVAKISRRLKTLARDLDVPVIALSQLNRAAENREDHRPRMADLRESGAIEQDADIVILLHRQDYYDPNDNPGTAEVIVAKNRNGGTATLRLVFDKPTMTFRNMSQTQEVPR